MQVDWNRSLGRQRDGDDERSVIDRASFQAVKAFGEMNKTCSSQYIHEVRGYSATTLNAI